MVMAKIMGEVLPDGLGLTHAHPERLMESTANTLPTAALLRHG
jgi:hypothetical protein